MHRKNYEKNVILTKTDLCSILPFKFLLRCCEHRIELSRSKESSPKRHIVFFSNGLPNNEHERRKIPINAIKYVVGHVGLFLDKVIAL
jgi:hypothetical protein